MYTQIYNKDDERLNVPEGYNGTAIIDGIHNEPEPETPEKNADDASTVKAGLFGNIFSAPLLKNILGNDGSVLSVFSKIGTEEILILATAAFLFFSGEGDKECAILLLLLLFIG